MADASQHPTVSPRAGTAPARGLLLAVDIGTTTTRAVVFDLDGRPVAEAYREVHVAHPQPNWAELDAEACWAAVIDVIGQVLRSDAVAAADVLAVGLTGLLHALVPVDADGTPLARAMLWMDQRCHPQVEWLAREHGEMIAATTGCTTVSTTFSAPKLRWLVEHDPDLVRRTTTFMAMKDFVRLRLTGRIATDPSDAGGMMLLDPRRGDWATPLLDAIGIPVTKLPPIRPSSEIAGAVTPAAAALTGLRAGTPVVVGGGDTLCTRIGTDAEGTDRACLYLGTAAWIAMSWRRAGAFSATATTGAALRWLVRLFKQEQIAAPGPAYERLLAEAATVPPGAAGLVFLPHLMGERGPVNNPQAKGVMFGLTLAHGQAELARAVLEGCAFHLRSILEVLSAVPLDELEIAVVGGGAKSPLWRTIIADVAGVTVLVPEVLEAGALGAAILAGVGVGVYADVPSAAAALVRVAARHTPDPARRDLYNKIYAVYQELETRLTDMYPRVPVAPS